MPRKKSKTDGGPGEIAENKSSPRKKTARSVVKKTSKEQVPAIEKPAPDETGTVVEKALEQADFSGSHEKEIHNNPESVENTSDVKEKAVQEEPSHPENQEPYAEQPTDSPEDVEPEKTDSSLPLEEHEHKTENGNVTADQSAQAEDDAEKESSNITAVIEEEEPDRNPSLLYWIPAVVFSFLLSLIPIYNILNRLNRVYLGTGELEGWLWRYWWWKQLMASLWEQVPRNWEFIAYTYFCAGNYPETGNVFDWQIFSLILEPFFGDPMYYNVKVFLIFFLNGLAGFALAKYLTRKPVLALMGSAIMILNPYVVYEIANGRPRQALLFSLPLFAMYLIDNFRTLSLKSALLAGFWLGISAAAYLFYGMAALFFSLIFIIVQFFVDHRKFTVTFWKYVAVMLLIFLIISGAFSFRYIEMALKSEKLPEVSFMRDFPSLDFITQKNTELDPRDALSQSILRYSSDSAPVEFPFGTDYAVNVPLVVSILALIPLIFIRPVPWLWVVTFLFFYVLSLGPYLKYGVGKDNYIKIAYSRPIPLLYTAFFKYVPFFSRLFSPIRMMGMMQVALVALFALNMSRIIDFLRETFSPLKKIRVWVLSLILVLVCTGLIIKQMVRMNQIPIVTTNLVYPDVYDYIRNQPGDFGLIEMPFRIGDFVNYYQMAHGKKVLWGWTYGSIPANFPQSRAKFLSKADPIEANTFVQYMEDLNRQLKNPLKYEKEDLEELSNFGYKYIILHERGCYVLEPEHGDVLYDYFMKQLMKDFGKPVKTGNEAVLPSALDDADAMTEDKTARIAIFKMPGGQEQKSQPKPDKKKVKSAGEPAGSAEKSGITGTPSQSAPVKPGNIFQTPAESGQKQ